MVIIEVEGGTAAHVKKLLDELQSSGPTYVDGTELRLTLIATEVDG